MREMEKDDIYSNFQRVQRNKKEARDQKCLKIDKKDTTSTNKVSGKIGSRYHHT